MLCCSNNLIMSRLKLFLLWDQVLGLNVPVNGHRTIPQGITVGLHAQGMISQPSVLLPDNTVSPVDKLLYNPKVPLSSVLFITLNQNDIWV